ncbi:sugar phosphate isomerase/epimerase family protein [Jannaschia aquimarina]|uniref:XylA_2 protein n=1 Tax=Jannaschia aquimarina TaxID=935700 RepID=A0A0D1EB17_9RHOB|nr:sugar phosphate isomerase/epimerase family protein [Jannaschia aquimarina]KIT14944.1 Xylose isomerase [Jannaschia aquimarina]SNS60050.1 xylose isomerase [Jannaschia aquimarina]
MSRPNRPRYATRLNAFKPLGGGILDWIGAAGEAGLDAADLNYPDHFDGTPRDDVSAAMGRAGLQLNGLAMRYYSDPGFKLGAFTNPDEATRRRAIDLTKRGMDTCRAMGGEVMTLWMGQDGVDYALQADFRRLWDDMIDALREVADHDPDLAIAVEYKPDEPRALALLRDIGHTLLAVREAERRNLGVTLDFAHVLYAGEMPACSAMLAARHSRLLGVHLNDGYGRRDDGLMVGTVHPVATVELFVELHRIGYDGAIYFDTFPDAGGTHPVEEARTNLAIVERLRSIALSLADDAELQSAIAAQDAAASQRIVARALYGA